MLTTLFFITLLQGVVASSFLAVFVIGRVLVHHQTNLVVFFSTEVGFFCVEVHHQINFVVGVSVTVEVTVEYSCFVPIDCAADRGAAGEVPQVLWLVDIDSEASIRPFCVIALVSVVVDIGVTLLEYFIEVLDSCDCC